MSIESEVRLARRVNWVGVAYKAAGAYPRAAKEAFAMRKHHMSEARYDRSKLKDAEYLSAKTPAQ